MEYIQQQILRVLDENKFVAQHGNDLLDENNKRTADVQNLLVSILEELKEIRKELKNIKEENK